MMEDKREKTLVNNYKDIMYRDFQEYENEFKDNKETCVKIRVLRDFMLEIFESIDKFCQLSTLDEEKAERRLFELEEIYGRSLDASDLELLCEKSTEEFLGNLMDMIGSLCKCLRMNKCYTTYISHLDQCNDSAADSKCEHDQ